MMLPQFPKKAHFVITYDKWRKEMVEALQQRCLKCGNNKFLNCDIDFCLHALTPKEVLEALK